MTILSNPVSLNLGLQKTARVSYSTIIKCTKRQHEIFSYQLFSNIYMNTFIYIYTCNNFWKYLRHILIKRQKGDCVLKSEVETYFKKLTRE